MEAESALPLWKPTLRSVMVQGQGPAGHPANCIPADTTSGKSGPLGPLGAAGYKCKTSESKERVGTGNLNP